jgi:hypothetical protein
MYAPETKWHKAYPFWERVGITLGDLIISGGNNFTATYSHTKSWAFGAGYTHIDWMDFYTVGTDIFNVEYSTQYIGERQALKFSGFYHNRVAENLEYEVGTSLLFGNGKFEFPESLPNMYPPELSYLTYKMFTQNFVGSLSYRYKKLQLTAQLNTGYVRYYDIDYAPVLPGTYQYIVTPFLSHQTDYYIDPALIVNFNFRRFGWQLHTGFPYAFGESKISKPVFSIGLGVSFKILRGKGE